MANTFESALGNLLEALRFVGDCYGERSHPDGLPMQAHLIEVVGVLWHVAEVRDQQVLLAGLVFRMEADGVASPAELRQVFGERVATYAQRAGDLSGLQASPLQRLRFKSEQHTLTAARGIRLAEAAVCFRRCPDTYLLPETLESFRASLPQLDAYLKRLRQAAST